MSRSPSSTLLAWYRTHGRDLPWRRTHDPYAIFISELMLQQTQVERVIPFYRNWLKRFPTWKKLAEAKTPPLLHAWAGLGYNRRALYAREAARIVVERGVPTDETEWRKLKGVGPYMAAALTEFVNHKRALVIDTNVRRVVGRMSLGLTFPKPADDQRILRALDELTPSKGHEQVPHALMDVGATICSTKLPSCSVCPFGSICKARKKLEGKTIVRAKKRSNERIREGKKFPDRIYRGKILALVRNEGKVRLSNLGPRVDPDFSTADEDWIEAMAERLAKDGLIVIHSNRTLYLPQA